jgi:hypothetical protein
MRIHTFHAVMVSISTNSASKFSLFRREKRSVAHRTPQARTTAHVGAPSFIACSAHHARLKKLKNVRENMRFFAVEKNHRSAPQIRRPRAVDLRIVAETTIRARKYF